tara:strand:- start:814 stop:1368 length:555 start_codon:yes stop_codon:yes gene_type:complete
MAFRVVHQYIGGMGGDKSNRAVDPQYETQLNTADFIHHIKNKGIPYTISGGQGYGDPEGASAGSAVVSDAPVSWDAWLTASPAGAEWTKWKSRLQTDRNGIVQSFDAGTQTYNQTIDWDSEGNYNKLQEIYHGAFGDTYFADSGCSSAGPSDSFAYNNSEFDAWRRANRNTRRHIKILVSKGNV